MRVIIIGGGIGGLSLAGALLGRGIECVVHERTREYRPCGAALTLWPNGVRAMRGLGIAREVTEAGWPIVASEVRGPRGNVLSTTAVGRVSVEAGAATVCVRRSDVQAALRRIVPEGVVRMGVRCVAVEESEGSVAARFADGGVSEGDVLVGADGLWSRVREHIAGEAAPRELGYALWRGIVPFEDRSLRCGRTFESWSMGERFGMAQVDESHVYWYAGLNIRPLDPVEDPLAMLRERFAGWHDPIPRVLRGTRPEGVMRTDIFDRPALRAWHSGRTVLLGDAAHPMTPDLGQGACSAIEDGVTLAGCLDGAPGPAEAFARYQTLRGVWTARVAAQSHRVSRISQCASPALCWARDTATRLTPDALLRRGLQRIVHGSRSPAGRFAG